MHDNLLPTGPHQSRSIVRLDMSSDSKSHLAKIYLDTLYTYFFWCLDYIHKFRKGQGMAYIDRGRGCCLLDR